MIEKPPVSYLRECLSADASGNLFWKVRPTHHFSSPCNAATVNKQRAGMAAGCVGKDGYIVVRVRTVLMPAHVIVWALTHGFYPRGEIDHADRDRTNNAPSNLRCALRYQNMWNMKSHKDSATGLKGVFPHRKSGKFRSRFMVRGETIDLGLFDTAEAASAAYQRAAKAIRGDFEP